MLLTDTFPFGFKGEPFLEAEVGVLSEHFRRVLVLPSRRETGIRSLPGNVRAFELPWTSTMTRSEKSGALLSRSAFRILKETLSVPENLPNYLRAHRFCLDILASELLKARMLQEFVIERDLAGAIFYDYWFHNTTLALSILRRTGVISTAVARAHRFDLYDEGWPIGRVPFRESKSRGLDLIAAISCHGAAYLSRKLPQGAAPVEVHRLGTEDHGVGPAPGEGTPTVVSCSTMIPRKRVQLIPQVLSRLPSAVHWVHIGDGPCRSEVEKQIEELNGRVDVDLLGQIPNEEVIDFYRSTPVSVFLSLSLSEGLPVSMMEAQSFGIPVLAIRTHGIPEIVTPDTGILMERDADIGEASRILDDMLSANQFRRDVIRNHFLDNFLARENHRKFVETLQSLHVSIRDPRQR